MADEAPRKAGVEVHKDNALELTGYDWPSLNKKGKREGWPSRHVPEPVGRLIFTLSRKKVDELRRNSPAAKYQARGASALGDGHASSGAHAAWAQSNLDYIRKCEEVAELRGELKALQEIVSPEFIREALSRRMSAASMAGRTACPGSGEPPGPHTPADLERGRMACPWCGRTTMLTPRGRFRRHKMPETVGSFSGYGDGATMPETLKDYYRHVKRTYAAQDRARKRT